MKLLKTRRSELKESSAVSTCANFLIEISWHWKIVQIQFCFFHVYDALIQSDQQKNPRLVGKIMLTHSVSQQWPRHTPEDDLWTWADALQCLCSSHPISELVCYSPTKQTHQNTKVQEEKLMSQLSLRLILSFLFTQCVCLLVRVCACVWACTLNSLRSSSPWSLTLIHAGCHFASKARQQRAAFVPWITLPCHILDWCGSQCCNGKRTSGRRNVGAQQSRLTCCNISQKLSSANQFHFLIQVCNRHGNHRGGRLWDAHFPKKCLMQTYFL